MNELTNKKFDAKLVEDTLKVPWYPRDFHEVDLCNFFFLLFKIKHFNFDINIFGGIIN